MLHLLYKTEMFLKRFSKSLSISYDKLVATIEESLMSFRLSWLLVDKFKLERTRLSWVMFSPIFATYLVKRNILNKLNKGKEVEIKAAEYLSSIGIEILIMNYRSQNGEIDIIALEGNLIRFIEVKSSYTSIIQPEERIDRDKVNKIFIVSEDFLVDLGFYFERRYDALLVGSKGVSYLRDYLA